MKPNGAFIKIIIFVISIPVFLFLETGLNFDNLLSLSKPFIFALGICLAFDFRYRKFLLLSSSLLFLGMIFFYLFWQLTIAALLGSIGFGLLIIYTIGLLPILFKKGYIEK